MAKLFHLQTSELYGYMNFVKRFILLLITLQCMFFTSLKAEVWTPETLPMVHLQDSLRFVCNPDGILSPSVVDSTDAILANLKRVKGIETVVVVVERIKGGDAYQFGMDLGRKYGVGDKIQRTGLIIILSTKDRKYRFLTGNGLEGTLPDGLCYNIQQAVMVPALKKGDWDTAIYESVKAVNGVIMGDESITRRYQNSDEDDAILGLAVVFAFVIFIMVFRTSSLRAHKCPQCHAKNAYTVVHSRRYRKGAHWYTEITWKCNKCGHTSVIERKDDDNDSYSDGTIIPPIFMSSGRHYRSGGGFSGGSFGGGSFGGGGAGGDF